MKKILAIDPGDVQSAVVYTDGSKMFWKEILPNHRLMEQLPVMTRGNLPDAVGIEMIASYGMPVGRTVFTTCVWIGRFYDQASRLHGGPVLLVPRLAVKLHLCKSAKAKDGNIRQALIDRYGEPGKKKSPGFLYGCRADEWAALAIATYLIDCNPLPESYIPELEPCSTTTTP